MPDLYSTRGRALKLVKLQNEPGLSVITQLRQALGANFGRVVDLFRDLDEDGNGSVSRSEFRSVLPMLGLQVHREDADAFFDTLDTDRSGGIDYDELHNKLRAGAEVTLDASLHPGAAGRIATVSLNTNSLRSGVLMLRSASAPGRSSTSSTTITTLMQARYNCFACEQCSSGT